ncbi:MAG: nucleotidyltransferase domain-containing protein [Deltaproteobacteria bacterium]|nr:nucleotidyltransferase domain-containing protein [Deltaproteobacteria bacterium]
MGKIKTENKYIYEITEKLKELNPYKIVLFGSYAKKETAENSDIDIMVILDSQKIASNYDEKMKNKLKVRRNIYEFSKKVPIDLLVYTKAEYDIISASKNSFYNEIKDTGKILYEKTDQRLD